MQLEYNTDEGREKEMTTRLHGASQGKAPNQNESRRQVVQNICIKPPVLSYDKLGSLKLKAKKILISMFRAGPAKPKKKKNRIDPLL